MGQGNYYQQPPPQQPPQQQAPPQQQGYYPPQHIGRAMEHADIIYRFVAYLIDGIILAIPAFILAAVLGLGAGVVGIYASAAISAVLGLLYFTFMEGGQGNATFGKKIMKLKVVDEQYRPITMNAALIRNIMRMLWGLTFYVMLIIDIIMILTRDDKQRLGDTIAHTYVVKEPVFAQQGYMPPPPQQYQQQPYQQQAPPPQQPPQQEYQAPPPPPPQY